MQRTPETENVFSERIHDITSSSDRIAGIRDDLLQAQRNEISEYHIYMKLSKFEKDMRNSVTLQKIGKEEYEQINYIKIENVVPEARYRHCRFPLYGGLRLSFGVGVLIRSVLGVDI